MDSGDPKWENEALPERISTLDAAILRISATLDLDTVSAAAVESARRLTGVWNERRQSEHNPFICIGLWTGFGIRGLFRAQFATRQYGMNSPVGQNPAPSVTRQSLRRGIKLTVPPRTRRNHGTHRVSAAPRSEADATGAQNSSVEPGVVAAMNVTSPIQVRSTGSSYSTARRTRR